MGSVENSIRDLVIATTKDEVRRQDIAGQVRREVDRRLSGPPWYGGDVRLPNGLTVQQCRDAAREIERVLLSGAGSGPYGEFKIAVAEPLSASRSYPEASCYAPSYRTIRVQVS